MIEFGKTLRLAREAKGYTTAQIAEITRMAPGTVTELEDEDFSHIAALIYGRGFVKLYCEAVGLDPKPMVEEFTAIYNGSRDVSIRERRQPESVTPPPPPPPTAPEPPPPPAQPAFRQANLDEPPPAPAPAPAVSNSPTDDFTASDSRPFSRYAAPIRQMHAPSVSPTVWRVGVLGLIALLMLWGIALGVRALYRATSGRPATETPPAEVPPATPEPAAVKPSAPPPVAKAKAPAPETKAPPPAAKAPVAKPPVAKAPTTKPPVAKSPTAKAPAANAPVAKKPAAKTQPAKGPATKTARKPQKIPSLYVD